MFCLKLFYSRFTHTGKTSKSLALLFYFPDSGKGLEFDTKSVKTGRGLEFPLNISMQAII